MNISPADAAMDLLLEKQPSLQFVSPQQIADIVVFLCSPHANSIRGAAWNIDGGWLAQ
jgi:3-hydroxybutyrate dehydrogenase